MNNTARRTEQTEAAASARPKHFRLTGRPALETFFNDHVVDIVENPDRYKALGIDFPTAIVLHGPPGCGKTFAVERLGEFLDWPIFRSTRPVLAARTSTKPAARSRKMFEKAMEPPHRYRHRRNGSVPPTGDVRARRACITLRKWQSSFVAFPKPKRASRLIVGMTNRLDMIDPAILRRGRFDHVIEVGMPTPKKCRS